MRKYKTARCVIQYKTKFLLAIHSGFKGKSHKRWGLVGGGIEWLENPEDAVKRELQEELNLSITNLEQIGAFPYKGHQHMIFSAEIDRPIGKHSCWELLEIHWFSSSEVDTLAKDNKLHAGYEVLAIQNHLGLKNKNSEHY